MISSVYIHIPFCSNICTYCDFAKMYYDQNIVSKYLKTLRKEIEQNYKNDLIKTIYIGGGTPTSLNIKELEELFDIIKIFKLDEKFEFTIECNLENLTLEKLELFKKNKINRLSIGVETFNEENKKFLNRKSIDTTIIYEAKKLFDNINIDLIYALPNQTIDDLDNDLNEFLKLDINHISIYSLMIEDGTILKLNNIEPIDEELDYKMYKHICKKLNDNNYIHYEISNFAKKGYESKHNLVYWNNEQYYGFGLNAASFINDKRITNTKSMTKYLNEDYIYEIEEIDKRKNMEYELILGLRKIEGIDLNNFYDKYKLNLEEVFDIKKILEEGKLIIINNHLKIPEEYLYISNDILVNFVGEE